MISLLLFLLVELRDFDCLGVIGVNGLAELAEDPGVNGLADVIRVTDLADDPGVNGLADVPRVPDVPLDAGFEDPAIPLPPRHGNFTIPSLIKILAT